MIIVSLEEKTVVTKRGPARKFVVKTDDGKTFDSFINDWNHNWVIGMPLNIEPDQWTSREYNGKLYYSVGAPRGSSFRPTVSVEPQNQGGPSIDSQLKSLAQEIRENHALVMEELSKVPKRDDVPF